MNEPRKKSRNITAEILFKWESICETFEQIDLVCMKNKSNVDGEMRETGYICLKTKLHSQSKNWYNAKFYFEDTWLYWWKFENFV